MGVPALGCRGGALLRGFGCIPFEFSTKIMVTTRSRSKLRAERTSATGADGIAPATRKPLAAAAAAAGPRAAAAAASYHGQIRYRRGFRQHPNGNFESLEWPVGLVLASQANFDRFLHSVNDTTYSMSSRDKPRKIAVPLKGARIDWTRAARAEKR